MSKARVLIISANLEIGGIERSLLGLLNALDYDRVDVHLFLHRCAGPFLKFLPSGPRLLPEVSVFATFQRPIVDIVREGYYQIASGRVRAKVAARFQRGPRDFLERDYLVVQKSWRFALPSLPMINGDYDLILSFMGPHYVATHRARGRIRVGWIHTDYRSIPNDGTGEFAMWDSLDYIAAVSEECRGSFVEKFPALSRKTMVVENILSPTLVRFQAGEFDVEREMPQEPGVFRILTVGRFSSFQKGFDDAIIACRALLDQGCRIRWYVIGYGPDEHMIRTLITENGLERSFIILGKKENPYPYMRACDLYVQPSRYEGKAVTVREAQTLGKPVMITRFPTSASQLDDGVDGYICEQGSAGIVNGIRFLMDNSAFRERIASTAAARDYSNRGEVRKIYALLESVRQVRP